ncbi:MAG TPA: class I SAM-dependent methyltransferase [Candidatus Paceibacterota bacterium]
MRSDLYQQMYTTERTYWWYRVRREIVHDLLNRYYGSRTDLSILDIGCGTGALMKELESRGTVAGTDYSESALEFCRSRGITNVKQADIVALPYADNSFDVAILFDVLEHIKDDAAALREIKRILKPGGRVLIAVPAFMFLWGANDIDVHHFRRYTLPRLKQEINGSGMKAERMSYYNFFLFIPIATVLVLMRIFGLNAGPGQEIHGTIPNKILYAIFHAESVLLRHMNYPFGISILAVAQK